MADEAVAKQEMRRFGSGLRYMAEGYLCLYQF
jgi:hypothetical protein